MCRVCQKAFEWVGGVVAKITDMLLNVPELLSNDDRKASIDLQTIELPTVSAKRGV